MDSGSWLWDGGTMHLRVDGVLAGEAEVGAVSIAAGAEVQIGAPGSTRTTFRQLLFLARAR
jgi:hypothetical protein